jgi:hypothetical protein
MARKWYQIIQMSSVGRILSVAALSVSLAAPLLHVVPAHANDPFATLDIDGSKPLVDFEMFKQFFVDDETGEYMVNPHTDKPFKEDDIRVFWAQMLNDRPDLRPFLEGNWDLLPGQLKNLTQEAVQDVEGTLHSIFALRQVPSLDAGDLGREGRRIARAFQTMGPERVSSAIATINKMDYFELEVMFRAMGTSVEALRPLLANRGHLKQALTMIPEVNEILKPFGGANGLLKQITAIHLPDVPKDLSHMPEKSHQRTAQYGPGGLFGVSAAALGILASGADDDVDYWDIQNDPTPPQGDNGVNPVTPYVPNPNQQSYIITEDDLSQQDAEDEADGITGEMGTCTDDADTSGNGENCAIEERLEEISPDDQPTSCPVDPLGGITAPDDSGCSEPLDTSAFELFDGALKDVHKQFDEMRSEGNSGDRGTNDTGKLGSDFLLLEKVSGYANQMTEFRQHTIEAVKPYRDKVQRFADMGGYVAMARSKVPADQRAAFDLFAMKHKQILGNMRRAMDGVETIENANLGGALAKLGDYEKTVMPLGGMGNAIRKITGLPRMGEQHLSKLKNLSQLQIGNYCLNAPSSKLIKMLGDVRTKGDQGFSIKTVKIPRMQGILKIINIINDLLGLYKHFQAAMEVIKTVQEIIQAVNAVKQLAGMADDISSMQTLASDYAEVGETVRSVQESAMDIDKDKILDVLNAVDDVNKQVKAYNDRPDVQKRRQEKRPDEEAVAVEVTQADRKEFGDLFSQINSAMNKGIYAGARGDWGKVANIMNGTGREMLSDDVAGKMNYVAEATNGFLDISAGFKNRDPRYFTRAAEKMPAVMSKVRSIPFVQKTGDNLQKRVKQFTTKMSEKFAKLDKFRGKICANIPGYTVRFCIAPFPWPVSQANLYMVVGRLLQDNRYSNMRMSGQIAFDYKSGLLGGRLGAGKIFAEIETAIPAGLEQPLKGVGGSLPSGNMKPLDTPAVSAMDLNNGWLYRRACPRDLKDYRDAGLFTDEFDETENVRGSGSVKRDPRTKAVIPQFAHLNLLNHLRLDQDPAYDEKKANEQGLPYLGGKKLDSDALRTSLQVPAVPSTCAMIKPKCGIDNPYGCYSPMMGRLQVDSCANLFVLSQALMPSYIKDEEAKPGLTEEFCQPLYLQPQNLCQKDLQGNCIIDPVTKKPKDEYNWYEYLLTAWQGTQVADFFPEVYRPVIYDRKRNYQERSIQEWKAEFAKPEFRNNPNAKIVASGIEYFYDNDPATGETTRRGMWDLLDQEKRMRMADFMSHPYEVIVDPTHPFSPRWDYEENDRDKYSRCTQFRLISSPKDKEVCGKGRILGGILPGLGKGVGEWGISIKPFELIQSAVNGANARSGKDRPIAMGGSVSCAGTPVDILRFREKNFNDCISCRLSVNERCMWSEPVQITVTSVIIEIIRIVIYYIVYAICSVIITFVTFGLGSVAAGWVGDKCGKFIRWLIDKILLDSLGHNERKSLLQAPKDKDARRCDAKGMAGCRSIIEFYRASLLMLRAGTSENASHLSGNPYDTGMYRLLTRTGGDDPAQFGDLNAVFDFYKYQQWTWRKAYRDFKRNYHDEWIEALRPLAEEYCPKKMEKGKSPHRCGKARRKLKKGFKGALKNGKKAIFKGLAKLNPRADNGELKIPFFCTTDRTKKGRKMFPPCSTSFNEGDRDESFCKKGCAVSISDCCNELAKPLVPMNKLRMAGYSAKDDRPGVFPEGMTFKEYFGDHRPYMARWDTGTEWGAVGSRKDQIDYLSPAGSRVHIVGVGRNIAQDSSLTGIINRYVLGRGEVYNGCKISGWGKSLDGSREDIERRFGYYPAEQCIDWTQVNAKGPNPLTSWTELKLYQARTFRYFRLNCIGQYEKLFKPHTAEDIILKAKGGAVPVEREGQRTTLEWPAAHRGFLWDPNPVDRFPYAGAKYQRLNPKIEQVRGLSNARPGDIVYLDADAYREAYRARYPQSQKSDQELEEMYVPMMGIVSRAHNEYDSIQGKRRAASDPVVADRASHNVEIWQTNAGTHPDTCGVTDMMGYGRKRVLYRSAATLLGNVGTEKNRFHLLNEIQQNVVRPRTPSGRNMAPVYTPLCHEDPMLRYCTLEDQKQGLNTVNLWDYVRIYRPEAMDYRGGCKVRPNKNTRERKRIDDILLDQLHEVPEEDIVECMNEGRDPPKVTRAAMRDTFPVPAISSLCAPGFSGRNHSFNRSLPLLLTEGRDGEAFGEPEPVTEQEVDDMLQNSHLLDQIMSQSPAPSGGERSIYEVFPSLKWRSDVRAQGCPRFANDTSIALQIQASKDMQLTPTEIEQTFPKLKTPHNKAKKGKNALGILLDGATRKAMPKTTWNASISIAQGSLRFMPCGGGVQVAGMDTVGPQRSSFDSMTPEKSQPAWMSHKGIPPSGSAGINMLTIGGAPAPITLYAPQVLNRGAGGAGIEERFISNLTIQECPGFAVNGLKADVFNVVVPPCRGSATDAAGNAIDSDSAPVRSDEGTVCRSGLRSETDNDKYYDGIRLNNGMLPMDAKTTLLTPKDSLLRIEKTPPGQPIGAVYMTFPNGVTFKHACKKMMTLHGQNTVVLTTDGKLKVLDGETAGEGEYHPLHADIGAYMIRPNGAVIFNAPKGQPYYVPIAPNAKVFPAINMLPDPSDVNPVAGTLGMVAGEEYNPNMPDVKPEMVGTRLPDDLQVAGGDYYNDEAMDKFLLDTDAEGNDICREQDNISCQDGNMPQGDREKTFTDGGAYDDPCAGNDAGTLSCAQSQGACALAPESDACSLREEDVCVAQPDGKACKDQEAFCASAPDYYVCKNKDSCSDKMGDGESDEWSNCYFAGDEDCNRNPDAPACQQQRTFCSDPANSNNYMCGGPSGDDIYSDE